jgi:hypothetical protein
LDDSLEPQPWLDQTQFNLRQGELAFNEQSAAVQELNLLLNNKHCSISQTLVQDFINRIVKTDRLLATMAINDALAAGASTKGLARPRKE